MVTTQGNVEPGGHCRIFIRPNRSLSWRGALRVFYAVAAVSAAIAASFAWLGLWLVAPFTGIELMALGGALYYCALRGSRVEIISFGSDEVQVQHADGRRTCFQRGWLRVRLVPPANRHDRSRLVMGSHGRTVEVGACLNEGERRGLAQQLKILLAGG